MFVADTRSSTCRDLIIKDRIVRAAYQFFPKHWEGVPEEARALVTVQTAPCPVPHAHTQAQLSSARTHASTVARPQASTALCIGGIACVLSLITWSSVPLTQISVPLTQFSVPLTTCVRSPSQYVRQTADDLHG